MSAISILKYCVERKFYRGNDMEEVWLTLQMCTIPLYSCIGNLISRQSNYGQRLRSISQKYHAFFLYSNGVTYRIKLHENSCQQHWCTILLAPNVFLSLVPIPNSQHKANSRLNQKSLPEICRSAPWRNLNTVVRFYLSVNQSFQIMGIMKPFPLKI